MENNMNIPQTKGKTLDKLADLHGIKRKRYFLFFKESDKKLKERILKLLNLDYGKNKS